MNDDRIPIVEGFRNELERTFRAAQQLGLQAIVVKSGNLHRRLGGYPGNNLRMPVCCTVMYAAMKQGDTVVQSPPKGKGATLQICYRLPR